MPLIPKAFARANIEVAFRPWKVAGMIPVCLDDLDRALRSKQHRGADYFGPAGGGPCGGPCGSPCGSPCGAMAGAEWRHHRAEADAGGRRARHAGPRLADRECRDRFADLGSGAGNAVVFTRYAADRTPQTTRRRPHAADHTPQTARRRPHAADYQRHQSAARSGPIVPPHSGRAKGGAVPVLQSGPRQWDHGDGSGAGRWPCQPRSSGRRRDQ